MPGSRPKPPCVQSVVPCCRSGSCLRPSKVPLQDPTCSLLACAYLFLEALEVRTPARRGFGDTAPGPDSTEPRRSALPIVYIFNLISPVCVSCRQDDAMSDEVSDFLRSVELLKERREEEDEARSRELEERILQEKRERQARRAERARSISPQKSSPANTPSPTSHRIGLPSLADGTSLPSPAFERSGSPLPRGVSSLDEPTDSVTDLSSSPTKENEFPLDSDIKRTSVSVTSPSVGVASARSPLSWQRRPRSQTSDRIKMRPLSMVAAENAARNSPNLSEPAPPAEETLSRDQIAQSLAGKDPSWFRQTADPGRGSGAFRKTQVEDEDTVDVTSSARTQLPGMSRPSATDSPRDSPRPESQTLPMQLGSPLPITSAQRLEPPISDAFGEPDTPTSNRHSIASPGRTSPARTGSPTKGMGGFVQSAMMKRSDSVKRWSVNSPGGLQRADSVVSPRASPRPTSMLFREGSSTPLSRPTSSYGKEEAEKTETQQEDQKEEKELQQEEDIPAGAKTPKQPKAEQQEESEKTTPPTSPSKTMDPRRWSPTKSSSWLEAALNKPESPKAKPAPTPAPNQPAWMLELNKAKAQKVISASAEPLRSPSFLKKAEVKTDGLMRSTPMGASLKPSALSSFPAVPAVATSDKAPVSDFRNNLRKPSPTNEAFETTAPSLPAKIKPEVASKNDFRANLKHRSSAFDANKSSEAVDELKTVFGSLRRTKTQNYVAPDELKDNIVRGKRGLSITGGPKKTERVDEFKDAILKKKEDFKKAQEEGRGVTRELSSASEKSLPEGLVKKLELNRTGTFSKPSPPELPQASPGLASSNRTSYFSPKPEISSSTTSKFSPEAEPTTATKQTTLPGRLSGRSGGSVGGLAERFNPALAGLIARGPLGASGPAKSPEASASPDSGEAAATEEPTKPGPQLTHMTKGRARGPKRKAPSSIAKAVEQPVEKQSSADLNKEAATAPPPAKPITSPKPSRFASSATAENDTAASKTEKQVTSPKPDRFSGSKTDSESVAERRKSFILQRRKSVAEVIALVDSSSRASKVEAEPTGQPISLIGSPSVKTRARSPTKVHEQVAALAALSQQASKPAEDEAPPASAPIRNRPRSTTKVHEQAAALAALAAKGQQAAEEPAAVSTPVRTRSRSPTKVFDQVVALAAKNQALGAAEEDATPAPSSPKKLDMKRISKFMDQQDQATILPEPVKSRPASPAKESFTAVASPQPEPLALRSSSPSKDRFSGLASPSAGKQLLSERPQLEPSAPIKSTPPVLGGGVGLGLTQSDVAPKPPRKDTKEFERPPRVPPKGARPLPEPPAVTSTPPRTVASPPPLVQSPSFRSPTKHASDVSSMLTDFFGSERPRRKYTTDAAEILVKRPVSTAPVRTQLAQLFQLTPEGKKIPVPPHHERVLFEREMYICPHSFIDSTGRNVNEIYFWAGDEVPSPVVEDTYLFAAREARSFGGKLIKLTQGKESSEFLQALGGIIIVRRGSSNKYDSLAPHMLCGRRYHGQVAFDEVDFSPLSLCSGFPYLITHEGKCTLWKGKGSDMEELGCARLVGMEFALSGDLAEVDEGYETPRFWALFGAGATTNTRPISADHWRLKTNYGRYSNRLFVANADASSSTQIEELSPFSQTDLSPSKIYVLDAFFEIYIIVGGKSQSQYAAFHIALDFAQEYAILAAGMEDRPFVPVATVVLEGIPRDLKAVFRKWRDSASPTRTVVPSQQQQQQQSAGEPQRSSSSGSNKGGGLRRARSLKIVPLNVALKAVAEN
ncbi:uncharacterized protein QC763_702710 [Podospora pseudopauciseta]|uniref:DUF4045 domain-containing protein n=1 Tax=Podospora pseudopauciseta TaxID=2093780 RepID=A0ABR0H0I7_9PEZI|nr:hypothetical protein QC763_702710 [Podospora pseudopauciseta]